MALALPDHVITVLGEVDGHGECPENLRLLGWVDDVAEALSGTETIVGGAGDGVTNLALASRARFICLPEARPFDEQAAKARGLKEQGAALVLEEWPDAGEWPSVMEEVLQLDAEAGLRLDATDGVERCARHISACAEDHRYGVNA